MNCSKYNNGFRNTYSPIHHKSGLIDNRYTITQEHNGYKNPAWVFRFCDDYKSGHKSLKLAIRAAKAYHKKMQYFTGKLPLRNDVDTVEYHRPPTRAEIKQGYGATHYRDFTIDECCNVFEGNYYLKRWFVAADGLRYYR